MSAWPETALREVLADAAPGFACGDDVEDGVFQFRMNNITTEGQLDLSKRRRVPRDYRNIDRFLVQPGDVLFNATNSPELVGKTAFFPGLEEPAVFSNHFLRLRPSEGQADGRYLTRWLNLQFQQGRFKAMCRQWVNQATVGRDALLSLRVPLPSLPEQRRIAEILDEADALRTKRRAALAQLDTLTQSIFLDMFGDPAAHGWRTTTISHVASDADGAIRTGPFGSQLLHEEFTDDGIAVLGIDNAVENEFRWGQRRYISEAKYRQLSRYTVRPGDVLITIMGTCGRCAIVPDDIPTAINTKHLCCITLDRTKCLPAFLHAYFLGHPIARRYLAQKAKGAIMEGLNMGIIKEMPIPLAPIDLQVEFVERLTQVGANKAAQRRSEANLEALFGSLQHRAFRGEL
jgi:type I restriction enzyme S subunit